jgi:hypothetical protein
MVWGGLATRWLKREPVFGEGLGTAICILMIAASAWSLPAAYRYPKQDFLGAMSYVDGERRPEDAVVTLGLTAIPYRDYYGRDWPEADSAAALNALRAQGKRVWLLYTFPIHAQTEHADIWDIIRNEFTIVRVFPGTVGGGEIYVCRGEPR